MVQAANQPATGNLGGNILNAVIGMIRGGDIIQRQEDAGDRLVNRDKQGGAPEGIKPIYPWELFAGIWLPIPGRQPTRSSNQLPNCASMINLPG